MSTPGSATGGTRQTPVPGVLDRFGAVPPPWRLVKPVLVLLLAMLGAAGPAYAVAGTRGVLDFECARRGRLGRIPQSARSEEHV